MNLLSLRTEVENRGFDPTVYGARINQFLNDAENLIARTIDYYVNEVADPISTISGTATYALPTNWARVRELYHSDVNIVLQEVSLRDIDRSTQVNGRPIYYALDGQNLHLYPTPDGVYTLNLRYWAMPPALVNDTDTPNLPADWHYILWEYAVWRCYEADDDAQMGAYWKQQFYDTLSRLAADTRFPSTDYPTQVQGMWSSEQTLSPTGGAWTLYGQW